MAGADRTCPKNPRKPKTQESPGGLEEVYADFTVVPRRAADGTVNGLLVIATDVTDRVAQQRAVQAAGGPAAGGPAAGRRR